MSPREKLVIEQKNRLYSILSGLVFSILAIVVIGLVIVACLYAEKIVLKKPVIKVVSALEKYPTVGGLKPQFVLLSFDGSRSLSMWSNLLSFARGMRKDLKPINFTFFISGVYLLKEEYRNLYTAPNGEKGESLIGFATNEDLNPRIDFINRAVSEGHEIASHANGHFDGHTWNFDEWVSEMKSFAFLFDDVKKNNGPGVNQFNFSSKNIVGFRAPELGVNNDMYRALASSSFLYDASGIQAKNEWPKQDTYGIWHIPLSTVYLNDNTPTISMDYSVYVLQSSARDIYVRGTPGWQKAYDELLRAYTSYFERAYTGNRAPVTVGHHFSEWNDGLYLEVIKNFASSVCGKEQVYCITYKELVEYLNAEKSPR